MAVAFVEVVEVETVLDYGRSIISELGPWAIGGVIFSIRCTRHERLLLSENVPQCGDGDLASHVPES